jgi:hypothetical protein
MGWPVEKILEEALKLDPEDRALIAAELSEPVEDPEEVRQAWVLAKRFPKRAFRCLLIPVTRDPISCDYPWLPDSARNLMFSIPTAST